MTLPSRHSKLLLYRLCLLLVLLLFVLIFIFLLSFPVLAIVALRWFGHMGAVAVFQRV